MSDAGTTRLHLRVSATDSRRVLSVHRNQTGLCRGEEAYKCLGPVNEGPSDKWLAAVLQFMARDGTTFTDKKIHRLPTPTKVDNEISFDDEMIGDTFATDLICTYSATAVIMDMVRRILDEERFFVTVCGHPTTSGSCWLWGWQRQRIADGLSTFALETAPDASSQLRLLCHADERAGAVYVRTHRAIHFHFYTDHQATKQFSCRSLDLVAHEMGHAVLDAIVPEWYHAPHESGALGVVHAAFHECFADATWMFLSLASYVWCTEVLAECGGDLRRPCRSNRIGSSLDHASDSIDDQRSVGERVFTSDVTAWSCGRGPYGMSIVFTSLLWDVIVHWFAIGVASLPREVHDGSNPAVMLWVVAFIIHDIWIRSVCREAFGEGPGSQTNSVGAAATTTPFQRVAARMSNGDVIVASIHGLKQSFCGAHDVASQLHRDWAPPAVDVRMCCDCLSDSVSIAALTVVLSDLSRLRGVEFLGISRHSMQREMLGQF